MTPDELVVTKFDESVPKLLQRDMLRSILACYQQSDKFAKRHYPTPEAMTVRGWIRRADIEVDLRGSAAKYVGAEANSQPNSTCSIFHSVVTVGAVKMTQSRLARQNQVARPSAFREEYAVESAQMLFGFAEKEARKVIQIETREYLFAILTHGTSGKDKSRPSFVRFSFPNKACDQWIAHIDLMKRFPDVVSEFYAPIVEAENEQRRIRLKKGIKRGGREKQA